MPRFQNRNLVKLLHRVRKIEMILRILAGILLCFLYLITFPFVFFGNILEIFFKFYDFLMTRWWWVLDSLFQFVVYNHEDIRKDQQFEFFCSKARQKAKKEINENQ